VSHVSKIRVAAMAILLAALAPAAAQAKWLRGESPHFIVYANSGEGTLRDYVQRMEDYDHLLRRMHASNPDDAAPAKLEIYLVNGPSDLRQVFPEMKGDWAGVYTAGSQGIFAVAFKPSKLYGDQDVRHEYYHHFMFQNFPGGYPGWMVEGMAEFFASTSRQGGQTMVGGPPPGRLETLAYRGWIPLADVIGKGPFEVKTRDVASYYAEAWLLTSYMMTDADRRKQLGAYIDAVRRGEDSLKAWTEKVGETPEVTQNKLRNQRLKGFALDKEPPRPVAITVSPMPASADDLLLPGQQIKHGVAPKLAPALLAQVRADAAKYPGDRLADLTLASAEIALGDPAKAEPLLKRRLDADAGDADARLVQAEMFMKQGDAAPDRRTDLYRDADRNLVPAVKAHPDDFRLLFAYARSREVEPDYPTANMVTVLTNAVTLAPQVAQLRFAAADACEKRGDIKMAIDLLDPLANDPHSMGIAKVARDRIERLRAKKGAAAVTPGQG
jgi:tetratricopeptide (TPR) repeat protein